MQTALKTTAVVQAGGRVEVVDAALPAGASVDVFVVLTQARPDAPRPSVLDVLANAPGHALFQTADDVDEYVRGERDAWER